MFYGLSLHWPWHPETIIVLLAMGLLYLLALRRVSRQAGAEPVKTSQKIMFFSALLIAALLLLTPVDSIGRTQLFSVHMAQVVLLITLCAPLIIFGSPASVLEPLVTTPGVRTVVRVLTRPLVASLLFNLTFLLWHTPRLYSFALSSEISYHLQMLTIFLCALLNWWPLIGSVQKLRGMSYPMQMLYAFFDGQPVDIFAFVLVFSGVPLYRQYAIPAQIGLSPFADQAVGGALLLIPGLVDLVVMSPLFFRWLGEIERRTRLSDQRREDLEEDEEWEEEESSLSDEVRIDK